MADNAKLIELITEQVLGQRLALVTIIDLLAKKGVATHREFSEHLQKCVDPNHGLLPEPALRFLEQVADGVMIQAAPPTPPPEPLSDGPHTP